MYLGCPHPSHGITEGEHVVPPRLPQGASHLCHLKVCDFGQDSYLVLIYKTGIILSILLGSKKRALSIKEKVLSHSRYLINISYCDND